METEPYLLPKEHFYSASIDKIFAKTQDDITLETINKLGFRILNQLGLHILVARHPKIPGFVFKFFKYNKFPGIDWQYWIKRVEGAKLIEQGIQQHGFKKFFKVPKKWLIKTHSHQWIDGFSYPAYVLMAEDMLPEQKSRNMILWRQKTTKSELEALYTLLSTYGLRDCARIANVPRCKDGKIAFVDTESYHTWPVEYVSLLKFLSSKNKSLWKSLIEQ